MIHENQEYVYPTNNTLGVLAGMLTGRRCDDAIAGAGGQDTRKLIQEKSIELR